MEGRRSGTASGDLAARRIADWLAAAGLRPGGDQGTYLQTFVLETSSRPGPASRLDLLGPTPRRLEAGREWTAHGGSRAGEVSGDVVFVGYGAEIPEAKYDDYAGVDVRGKIALALDGAPAYLTNARVSRPDKLIAPQRRGAAALLIAGGELPPPEKTSVQVGLVSGAVTPAAAAAPLAPPGRPTADAAAGGSSRTLVFALFGAEELGLIGSRHYVNRPAVPLDRTVAMVNFDMVGRLQGRSLNVGGGDSGNRLRVLVSDAAQLEGVPLDVHGSPYGPSDHSQFYAAGVPVLFFYTGGHSDYHQPSDTADKIDAAGLARVAAVGARVVERLASDARLVYAQVAQPARRQASG